MADIIAKSPMKKGKGKAMKKGKGKAMKKGKGGRKPVVDGEGVLAAPGSPSTRVPKISIRKRVLDEVGSMKLEDALRVFQKKQQAAEKDVAMAVQAEAAAVKESERLKVLYDKASAHVETLLSQNKDKRSKGSEARLKLLDLEKDLALLIKTKNLAETEVEMLKEEAEGEGKRRELREAKENAKKAIEAAKEAAKTEKEAMGQAKAREKEASAKAREEEADARRQAKDMQELAKEKAKEHKKQEIEDRKRAKQEQTAAKGGRGRESSPKRVKIVAGEDVD